MYKNVQNCIRFNRFLHSMIHLLSIYIFLAFFLYIFYLSLQFYYMKLNDPPLYPRLNDTNSALKRSSSVAAIIHGGTNDPYKTKHYYIDSLQRFSRDHVSTDKQQRQQKRIRDQANRARRRSQTNDRQQYHRNIQENNFNKLTQRQSNSLLLHQMGSKLSIHSHSEAIDPINQRYQNTQKGRIKQKSQMEKKVNTLVRTHHLQTVGTSGYNIINGQSLAPIQAMVPSRQYPVFHDKLSHYYDKFRIRPNDVS